MASSGCCARGLQKLFGVGMAPTSSSETPTRPKRQEPVVLNVYDIGSDDLGRTVNQVLRSVGSGAYHLAVEVYGREWSYGATETGPGSFSCLPRASTQHQYRESISLGNTSMSRREVLALLRSLEWPGVEYNILRKNCCHWCVEFCRGLGVDAPPEWTLTLASEVAKFDDNVVEAVNSVTEAVDTARRRTTEFNEKVRETFETETHRLKGQAEETWSTLLAKVGELDHQVKTSVAAVAEDFHRQTADIQKALVGRSPSTDGPSPASRKRCHHRSSSIEMGFGSCQAPQVDRAAELITTV